MMTSCSRSIKLIDVFPDWLIGGGVFAIMAESVVLPWSEIIDGASLDVEYFGNRSGSKPVAPLVYKLLDDSGELSEENRAKLVGAIWNRYGRNWTALYNTTIAEYNPLDNYNMEERDIDHGSNSTTYGKTVDETVEREGNNQTSVSNDNTVNRKHYGFNSADGVPVDTDSAEGSTAGSGSETITEERNIKDGGSDSTTTSNERTVTRKGNIGVTTSQQLLQSERELWFWNFIDSVFADVDTMLTLAVFDHSECIQIFKGGSGADYILPVASPSVLGGIQPNAKTAGMTQPVGVDSAGKLWVQVPEAESYTLPVATSTTLGGVKPDTKTSAMTQPVGVDSSGKLWVQVPEAESYTLPVASPSVLGGVKPITQTSAMTQLVGVDSVGRLWTQPTTLPEYEIYIRITDDLFSTTIPSIYSVSVSSYTTSEGNKAMSFEFNYDVPSAVEVSLHAGWETSDNEYSMTFSAINELQPTHSWSAPLYFNGASESHNYLYAKNQYRATKFELVDNTNDTIDVPFPISDGSYLYVHLKFLFV